MTIRRLTLAIFALALPLAVSACDTGDNTLAEADLSSQPGSSSAEADVETTASDSSSSSAVSGAAGKSSPAGEETEDSPQSTTTKAESGSDKGPCEWRDVDQGEPGELVSFYCDGKYAGIGTYATDHTEYMLWDGNFWVAIEEAGQTHTGFRCYDEAKVEELGFPAELKEHMIMCE